MAQMSTADINDLPDSAFAHIEPGGSKDSGGKTVPRSLRHYPVHDKPHVRDALGRAQAQINGDDADAKRIARAAMPKIKAAAEKMDIGQDSDGDGDGSRFAWNADAERRFTPGPCEMRAAAEGRRIGGYGAVYEKLSRNLGGFVETVSRTAFNQSRQLGWPSVVCRYNHDPNMVLGTSPRTLELRSDNIGLDYAVLPPQSRQDIMELVERGDVRFSSFSFKCPPGGDEWRTSDQGYPLRILHEVALLDVAPVLDPAYTDATAGLRSLARAKNADFEEVRSMAAADELRRFFARTDRPSYQPPPKPAPTGAEALLKLMERRFDPFVGEG